MKKTLLLSLIFLTAVSAQLRTKKPAWDFDKIEPVFSTNVFITPTADSSHLLYYTYNIPYNKLVFVRTGKEYSAEVNVVVELIDSVTQKLKRESKQDKIIVNDFNLTNSKSNYLQGFIKFKFDGKYCNISPVITDINSQREIQLKPEKFLLEDYKKAKLYNPVIVNSGEYYCGEEKVMILSIYGGIIPFSSEKYDLIIPVNDQETEKLDVTILQMGDTIFSKIITNFIDSELNLFECDARIVVKDNEKVCLTRNFILDGINEFLNEGPVIIKISEIDNNFEAEFNEMVFWTGKPFSLRDPERAIEFLEFIENEQIISDMLDVDEEEYEKVLRDYWLQFDPSPESTFNPVMAEYYKRIDYAAREFKPVGRDNGVATDRAKVYIRFGKPEKIERTSNEQGNVVETWNYIKQSIQFVFVDKKGTGIFNLIEE